MLPRMSDSAEIRERLDRLECSNRRMKLGALGVALLAFACGAGTTAQYAKLTSHHLAVFGSGEKGEVVTLSRSAKGGQIVVRDAAGKARVTIDADGVRTADAAGKMTWDSAKPR